MGVSSFVVLVFAGFYVSKAAIERQRADEILLNTLPKGIVQDLKSGRENIADLYDSASVLFCDVVGSTPLFSEIPPGDAVDRLNEMFSAFDRLVEKYHLEKIRTIGDNYMVAGGVPVVRPDHAKAVVGLALDMIEDVKQLSENYDRRLEVRIGVNSGPVVAGVIGTAKLQYDLWGDTVNVASRMEYHGEAGRVHISSSTHDLVENDFSCESRGSIMIKGKEKMETWFVSRRKSEQ